MTRTQIYLEPGDHRALREEAAARGISMTELIREIVRGHLDRQGRPVVSAGAFERLVGLGTSGIGDISENHDAYLGEALRRGHTG